jgi:hypothetical protein
MTVLSQFNISSATPQKDNSPIGRFRRRLTDAIGVQIDLAKAENSGETLSRTRQRWVKDPASGERQLKAIPIRVRRWWWRDGAGKTQIALRYGAKTLEIAPGKSAIEIGGLDELPAKLGLIREAILAGELDGCAGIAAIARPIPAKPSSALTVAGKKAAPKSE